MIYFLKVYRFVVGIILLGIITSISLHAVARSHDDSSFPKQAFVLLKGVTPSAKSEQIRNIYYVFARTKIPFMMEVTPIEYTDTGKNYLSKTKYLLRNVQAMIALGASVVLKSEKMLDDAVMTEEMRECLDHDIIPMACSHQGASHYFSTLYQQGLGPENPSDHTAFQRALYGNVIFPHPKDKAGLARIYQYATREPDAYNDIMGIVVEPTASRYQLIKFIQRLKKLGYTFIDLKTIPGYVEAPLVKIFVEPSFYVDFEDQDLVYGNRRMIDLLKFQLHNLLYTAELLNLKFQRNCSD